MRRVVRGVRSVALALAVSRLALFGWPAAHAQDAPPSPPAPARQPADPTAQIQAQLQRLQAQNEALFRQLEILNRKYDELMQTRGGTDGKPGTRPAPRPGGSGGQGGEPQPPAGEAAPRPRTMPATRTAPKAGGSGGQGGEPQPPAGAPEGSEGRRIPAPEILEHDLEVRSPYVPDMEPLKRGVAVSAAEGLQFQSADGYFNMVFHNLTQLDYRIFDPTGDPLHDSFNIPRQRWYFQGAATPFSNFYTVINRGYNSLDVLDSWVDFNFAPDYRQQLQFRVGRMKTPYTYEYIKISESDLIAPERSLFVGNFAPNREEGAMAHGQLFGRRLEYMVGVFNGPRRSFEDFNSGKDFFFFSNTKPFLHTGVSWLEQLNLAGSFNVGSQRNPTQPQELRTASDQSPGTTADLVSPTFLAFNNNVFENGWRAQWAGDVAYYYGSFTFLGGYQGGYQNYSIFRGTQPTIPGIPTTFANLIGVDANTKVHVPLLGWSIAATYFITGEEITRRVYLVEPIRPFGLYNGRLNPGAIELYARVANLQLGDQVFSRGLVDPTFWSNRVTTTDVGVNWYLNHYVRMYIDWQHSQYNNATYIAPGQRTRFQDLYWLRTQVFF